MIAGADDDDDLLSEVQIADKKLKAALAVEAEVLALRQECAPMVVSDALLSGLSQAGVLAALQALFNVSAMCQPPTSWSIRCSETQPV